MVKGRIRGVLALSGLWACAACGGPDGAGDLVRATPPEGESKGALVFLAGDGVPASTFDRLATTLSSKGWTVTIAGGAEPAWRRALGGAFDPGSCSVVGGSGAAAAFAMDYAAEHDADGADGVILLGGLATDGANYMLEPFLASSITGEFDAAVTSAMAQAQGRFYPGRSFFLNIQNVGRGGLIPGETSATDSGATQSLDEQHRITIEVFNDMMLQFCEARELRIKELAKEAARKAEREGAPN